MSRLAYEVLNRGPPPCPTFSVQAKEAAGYSLPPLTKQRNQKRF